MRRTYKTPLTTFFLTLTATILLYSNSFAQNTPDNGQTKTIQMGAIEITPSRSSLTVKKERDETVFLPTLRFRIKNKSIADIRIILFKNSIVALDERGESLFKGFEIASGGIPMSDVRSDNLNRAFDDKSKFVLLAPEQVFELQITNNDYPRKIEDKDNSFIRSYRPQNFTINGALGIILADNATEIRAFSFSEVPIQTTVR